MRPATKWALRAMRSAERTIFAADKRFTQIHSGKEPVTERDMDELEVAVRLSIIFAREARREARKAMRAVSNHWQSNGKCGPQWRAVYGSQRMAVRAKIEASWATHESRTSGKLMKSIGEAYGLTT